MEKYARNDFCDILFKIHAYFYFSNRSDSVFEQINFLSNMVNLSNIYIK